MGELYQLLDIKGGYSTAFHPQTDGQTEQLNRELEIYLRTWTSEQQDDWDEWLPLAEFAYNNWEHSSTGFSPFFLTCGHHPCFSLDGRKTSINETAMEFSQWMKILQEKASLSLTQAAKSMKDNYDRHRSPSQNLQIGEHVWLEAINICTKRPMKKLDDKHWGPFLILEKVGGSAFKLDIPWSWKHHPVFNKALLTRFIPASFKGQDIPRPPLELDEEGIAVYEVKSIIDK
jgi:hypothetical protein